MYRTEQHEAILELARRLDNNSNPASLQRCADYLAAHRHYDAAVDLLTMAGKVLIHVALLRRIPSNLTNYNSFCLVFRRS